MASGSSGRNSSGLKGSDFGSDDDICSIDDFSSQDAYNGRRMDSTINNSFGMVCSPLYAVFATLSLLTDLITTSEMGKVMALAVSGFGFGLTALLLSLKKVFTPEHTTGIPFRQMFNLLSCAFSILYSNAKNTTWYTVMNVSETVVDGVCVVWFYWKLLQQEKSEAILIFTGMLTVFSMGFYIVTLYLCRKTMMQIYGWTSVKSKED